MTPIEKNIMKPKGFSFHRKSDKEYKEEVIEISRVSRVSKGGRRIRFRALVVVGNNKGKIGMGIATATEVSNAVKKAVSKAKNLLIDVPVIDGTIPHEIVVKFKAAKLILKPASKGTSIVAGGAVRTILELAGVEDALAKILGTRNKITNVYAVFKALKSFDQKVINGIKSFSGNDKTVVNDNKQDKDLK